MAFTNNIITKLNTFNKRCYVIDVSQIRKFGNLDKI